MDFALRIQHAVELGRANAEALMLDHVHIWRDSTEPAGTDEWGQVTAAPPTLVYDGKAKAQNDASYPSMPNIGDTARTYMIVSSVHLPYGTTSVQSGDVCEWIESQNPRLVGQKVRLRADQDKTWQTAVRFNVVEMLEM